MKTVLICENDDYGTHRKPFETVEAFQDACEADSGERPRLFERGMAVYDSGCRVVLRRVPA